MKFKTFLAIVFLLPMMSFAQSDLQTILKGGELLLGGLSIFKVAKSDTKSDSKIIESVCVKNKLVDKITFRIVGKNEEGDEIKKNSLSKKTVKNVSLYYPKAFIPTKLYYPTKKFTKKENTSLMKK